MFPSVSSLFRLPHGTLQDGQHPNDPQETSKATTTRRGFMAKFHRKERRDLISNPISGSSYTLRFRKDVTKRRAERLEVRTIASIAANIVETTTCPASETTASAAIPEHELGQIDSNNENPSYGRRGGSSLAHDGPCDSQRINYHKRNVQGLHAPQPRPPTHRQPAQPVCGESGTDSEVTTTTPILTSNSSNDPSFPSRLSAQHFDLPMSLAALDLGRDFNMGDEAPAVGVANSHPSSQIASYHPSVLRTPQCVYDEDIEMAEAVETCQFTWTPPSVDARFDPNTNTSELLDNTSEVDAVLPTSVATVAVAPTNVVKDEVVERSPPPRDATVAAAVNTEPVVCPAVTSSGLSNLAHVPGFSPTLPEDRQTVSHAAPPKSSYTYDPLGKNHPILTAKSFVFGRESDKIHYAKASEATKVWCAGRHSTRTRARASPYSLVTRATWKTDRNKKGRDVDIANLAPSLPLPSPSPIGDIDRHDAARNVLFTMLQATGMAAGEQLAEAADRVDNLDVVGSVQYDQDEGEDADTDTDDEDDEDSQADAENLKTTPVTEDDVNSFLNSVFSEISRRLKPKEPYNLKCLAESLDL